MCTPAYIKRRDAPILVVLLRLRAKNVSSSDGAVRAHRRKGPPKGPHRSTRPIGAREVGRGAFQVIGVPA